MLESVFHPDATCDYGFFRGAPADFAKMACGALREHHANHHLIGQLNILELDGDVALGEVYFQAFHRLVAEGRERDLFVAGRYVDRYERRDGVWKIAHRSEVNDWTRTVDAADSYFREQPAQLRGARAPRRPVLSAHRAAPPLSTRTGREPPQPSAARRMKS